MPSKNLSFLEGCIEEEEGTNPSKRAGTIFRMGKREIQRKKGVCASLFSEIASSRELRRVIAKQGAKRKKIWARKRNVGN